MSSKETVTRGQFIHWRAQRYYKQWDTYGIIIRVHTGGRVVTVKTLEDLKDFTLVVNGEAWQNEVRLVTRQEVVESLVLRKQEIQITLERKLTECNQVLAFIEEFSV